MASSKLQCIFVFPQLPLEFLNDHFGERSRNWKFWKKWKEIWKCCFVCINKGEVLQKISSPSSVVCKGFGNEHLYNVIMAADPGDPWDPGVLPSGKVLYRYFWNWRGRSVVTSRVTQTPSWLSGGDAVWQYGALSPAWPAMFAGGTTSILHCCIYIFLQENNWKEHQMQGGGFGVARRGLWCLILKGVMWSLNRVLL